MDLTSAIAAAVILDLFCGDPKWLPHPVRWMGKCILTYEATVRSSSIPLRVSGLWLALFLPVLSFLLAWETLHLFGMIDRAWAWLAEVILLYQSLSVRGLYDETQPIYRALKNRDMGLARACLSQVVGRDTDRLNSTESSRAVVETVAEGTVDGIFSPLFFAAIGGAPMAIAFKAVSTLDSMVGYKNERFAAFGWASARLDDCCNYLPARFSLLLIPLAAKICRLNARRSLSVGWRDRLKHTSPNAGHAEAAFAGALNVRLGGTNEYQGIPSEKPILHSEGNPAGPDHIPQAWRLMFVSSILFAFLLLFIL